MNTKFETFTVMFLKNQIFLDDAPCRLLKSDRLWDVYNYLFIYTM